MLSVGGDQPWSLGVGCGLRMLSVALNLSCAFKGGKRWWGIELLGVMKKGCVVTGLGN